MPGRIPEPATLLARLFLFGSAARGEAGPASDIDLFIAQADPDRFDLIDLIDLQDRLRAALDGVPIDLATRASLHPALRPDIEASAVRVF